MKNILLVNKPKKWTSHDVCNKLKRHFKLKKVGHAGTLDPNATGLLVIGINDATKALNNLVMDEKEYIATIQFNKQTTTYDVEGEVINETSKKVGLKDIENILNKYNNKYFWQYPPIYSSIKINGKKLYDYARSNQTIDLPKRTVYTNEIELKEFDYLNQILVVRLNVSKGFYVRSFANDIGLELHNFAYLKELHRTKSGQFDIKDSLTIDEILKTNIIS